MHLLIGGGRVSYFIRELRLVRWETSVVMMAYFSYYYQFWFVICWSGCRDLCL